MQRFMLLNRLQKIAVVQGFIFSITDSADSSFNLWALFFLNKGGEKIILYRKFSNIHFSIRI
jgi:hypothetical protein